jgi:hypothetical protein
MASQLTKSQRIFVDARVGTGIGVKATVAACNASAIAVEEMNLDRIATKQ